MVGGAAAVDATMDSLAARCNCTTLRLDAGDEMQGSLLSNVGDGTPTGKGLPTIDVYNTMGYNVATFGNHEFDWGQANLADRTAQAAAPADPDPTPV